MDTKTKRGIVSGGVVLVAVIAVLALLLVEAKGEASDTKDQLASARSSASAQATSDKAALSANASTIKSQSVRIKVLDPPAWSKSVAAQMYLAIVKEGSARLDAFNKIKTPSLKQSKDYASDMTVLLNKQAQKFQAGHWPKFVKGCGQRPDRQRR